MTTKIKNMKQIGSFNALPPAPGCCQVCAHQHEPDQPHDAQSIYYIFTFAAENGRAPTWSDAMAHCDEETRTAWTVELAKFGVVVDSFSEEHDHQK